MFHGRIISRLVQGLTDAGTADDAQDDLDEVEDHEGEYGKGQRGPEGHFLAEAEVEVSHEPDGTQGIAADKPQYGRGNLPEEMAFFSQTEAGNPGHHHKAQVVAAYRRKENACACFPHGKDGNAQKAQQEPYADGDGAPFPSQHTACQGTYKALQSNGHGADGECEL